MQMEITCMVADGNWISGAMIAGRLLNEVAVVYYNVLVVILCTDFAFPELTGREC